MFFFFFTFEVQWKFYFFIFFFHQFLIFLHFFLFARVAFAFSKVKSKKKNYLVLMLVFIKKKDDGPVKSLFFKQYFAAVSIDAVSSFFESDLKFPQSRSIYFFTTGFEDAILFTFQVATIWGFHCEHGLSTEFYNEWSRPSAVSK